MDIEFVGPKWYNLTMTKVRLELIQIGPMSEEVRQLAEIISNREVYLPFNAGKPGGAQNNMGIMEHIVRSSRPAYVLKANNQVVGFVGFGSLSAIQAEVLNATGSLAKQIPNSQDIYKCRNIAYFVDPKYHGMGLGTNMVQMAIKNMFEDPRYNVPAIVAFYFVYDVGSENTPSHKLLMRMGFNYTASTVVQKRAWGSDVHSTHMYLTRENFYNKLNETNEDNGEK